MRTDGSISLRRRKTTTISRSGCGERRLLGAGLCKRGDDRRSKNGD
jgi:hypothetical protein